MATAAAKQKASVAPTYGSLPWIRTAIEAGRTEKSIYPITITPLIAEQLLQLNTHNRTIKVKKLEQFQRMMRAGLWRGLNGETIKIKTDGTLGDGQHRLTAIAKENVTVITYMLFGADEADIATVDQGAVRTAGDIARLAGHDFSMERASIARLLIAFEESGGASLGKTGIIGNAEINARIDADERIHDAAQYASQKGRRAPGLPGSAIGFCWYLFTKIHIADAEKYLGQVCSGINLSLSDPAATVRDYLIRRVKIGGRDRTKKIEALMRGWNAFREQREMRNIVTNGVLPELV